MAYENLSQALIKAESGGNRYARNSRSSAGGAGQFIDSTWLAMVTKHRPDIAAGKTREQLLQLKYDPTLSAEMTQAYAADNASYLKSKGIEPTEGALSLAHFAGPSGAAALYADPGKSAVATLGEAAARANPFLQGKTGADVIAWADKRISPAKAMAATLRERFATQKQPEVDPAMASAMASAQNSAPQPAAAQPASSGYDAERLASGTRLQKAGQDIAAKYANPWGAIGGSIVSGIGGVMEGMEGSNKKADEEALVASLSQGPNIPNAVKLLLNSKAPEYRQAGIEAALKLSTAKPNNEWTPTADGTAVVNKATGEVRPTGIQKPTTPTDIEKRAVAAGLEPGSPEYKDYVLKGPRDLTLTDAQRKQINAADDAIVAGKSAVKNLRSALDKNDQAYSGPLASLRGYVSSQFGSEGGKATRDVENLVGTQALEQMRSIFGASPTEGERKILLELQGSVNEAPDVRGPIWERGLAMAENRLRQSEMEANQLRGGTYFKPGGGQSDVTSGLKPQDQAAVVQQAKDAIAKGADPAKVMERLRGLGIDTSGF